MSINLLTVPNTYDLFCGTLTITNEASGLSEQAVVARKVIDTNVPILLGGIGVNQVISGYAIQGVTQSTFPAVFPSLEYEVLENDFISVVNVKIPKLTVLATTGGVTRPTFIQFRIPNELKPPFPTSVAFTFRQGPPFFDFTEPGLIIVTSQFSTNYIQLTILNSPSAPFINTFGDSDYPMLADIDFSYTL
jgi:hypothetical protein